MLGLLCVIERFCEFSIILVLVLILMLLDYRVTRLIKASKSKPNRGSFIANNSSSSTTVIAAAASTLSLKSDFSTLHLSSQFPTLPHTSHPPSSPVPFPSPTTLPAQNSKLTAAQAELQACEAHLAQRERELDEKRISAVRVGLGARCQALVECGWAWGEMGREALRVLEGFGLGGGWSFFLPFLFSFSYILLFF
jgi:hypothetical protein